MADPLSIAISSLALSVSVVALWLVHLRRGRLAMTKPTIVFFGYDTVPRLTPKIFLRTLLYSTSPQGKVIEGMYARLRHGDTEHVFGFWGYGETEKLVVGSGLYVGQAGFAANHHFVQSVSGPASEFSTGPYTVEVFARLVGNATPQKLLTFEIVVTPENAVALAARKGVMFELNQDSLYIGHSRDP